MLTINQSFRDLGPGRQTDRPGPWRLLRSHPPLWKNTVLSQGPLCSASLGNFPGERTPTPLVRLFATLEGGNRLKEVCTAQRQAAGKILQLEPPTNKESGGETRTNYREEGIAPFPVPFSLRSSGHFTTAK